MTPTERIRAWIMALGGPALLLWIRNPSGPLYLYGPPATGKTLFQRAWADVKQGPIVITGQSPDPRLTDIEFANPGKSWVSIAECVRIKVYQPDTAWAWIKEGHVTPNQIANWLVDQ